MAKTISCKPTDEGFAVMASAMIQAVIYESTNKENARSKINGVVEIVKYLGLSGYNVKLEKDMLVIEKYPRNAMAATFIEECTIGEKKVFLSWLKSIIKEEEAKK